MALTTPTSIGLVGGGLASYQAAETLRERGYEGRLTLICDEPYAPYDRPPLSKDVLLGTVAAESTELLGPERVAELDLDLLLGYRVEQLDTAAGELVLSSGGRLAVDRVLLATGGRARQLAVPGAELGGVASLRTRDDAERVRAMLIAGAEVVVIGGGFVGLEVAAAARARGCSVTVVEAADRLLGRVLPEAVGARILRDHQAGGVVVELGVAVAELVGDGQVREVVLTDGRRLPATAVIVGIGMVPADALAADAGITVGDGIWTDAGGRTSHPHVFAAGDVARSPDTFSGGGLVRVEQWQNAQVQGTAVACTMLGVTAPAPPVPWFWSDQGDLRLQVAGVPGPGQDIVHRGDPEDGSHCALHLSAGRVVAAVGINRPRDVRGAIALMEAGGVVDAAALSDESQDLRRMARTLASV